jgi:hypothetical protein
MKEKGKEYGNSPRGQKTKWKKRGRMITYIPRKVAPKV